MNTLEKVAAALYGGKADEVASLVRQALQERATPAEVLKEGLIAGMDKVGCDFRENVLYVPEVLVASRAMHAGMDVLRPLLVSAEASPTGTVAIGTVQGDIHDIGKNLVVMMLEGAGFQVVDLGVDVKASQFVEAIVRLRPDILGLSALLSTTMPTMGNVIRAISDAGLTGKIKIVVGGAPVTDDFAVSIGAHGYAPDAASAVVLCRGLVKQE